MRDPENDLAAAQPERPTPPADPDSVKGIRERFETLFKEAEIELPAHWHQADLRGAAKSLETQDPGAYSRLVDLKKKYTESPALQNLLYSAITGFPVEPVEVKRFMVNIRQYIGAKRPQT